MKLRDEADKGYEQFYYEGSRARSKGQPISSNPYSKVGQFMANWNHGWNRQNYRMGDVEKQDIEENTRVFNEIMRETMEVRLSEYREAKAAHDDIHCEVATKLAELGIDPYQLRDYLAGLPERN